MSSPAGEPQSRKRPVEASPAGAPAASAARDGDPSATGATAELDLRGQRCPAPIIALGRAVRAGRTGIVELLADDPAAAHDVPAWCTMTGAELVSVQHLPAGATRYTVRLPAR